MTAYFTTVIVAVRVVLQRAAVCCSVWQFVEVFWNVL